MRKKEKKISLDYLRNRPNMQLFQNNEMFKINTDTCLLGEFYENKDPSVHILDIGTNNGALLLYASLFPYASLTGIDIQKEALELARKNLKMHSISNFSLIHHDVLSYEFAKQYEVILINPPYFHNGLKNKNPSLKDARHDDTLPLDLLFQKCQNILTKNGYIYLVHRLDYLPSIQKLLDINNFVIVDQRNYVKTVVLKIAWR